MKTCRDNSDFSIAEHNRWMLEERASVFIDGAERPSVLPARLSLLGFPETEICLSAIVQILVLFLYHSVSRNVLSDYCIRKIWNRQKRLIGNKKLISFLNEFIDTTGQCPNDSFHFQFKKRGCDMIYGDVTFYD